VRQSAPLRHDIHRSLSTPRRQEIAFGLVAGDRHDYDARQRIWTAFLDWNERNKAPGQHQGPLTAGMQRVVRALLFDF
jgi:hypothetical protein